MFQLPEIHGAVGGLSNVEGWAKIMGVWVKNGEVWAKIEKVGKECIFVGKGVISLGKEILFISITLRGEGLGLLKRGIKASTPVFGYMFFYTLDKVVCSFLSDAYGQAIWHPQSVAEPDKLMNAKIPL